MYNFIEALQEKGHRTEMVTKNKTNMLEVAVGMEKKSIEAYYKPHPAYLS